MPGEVNFQDALPIRGKSATCDVKTNNSAPSLLLKLSVGSSVFHQSGLIYKRDVAVTISQHSALYGGNLNSPLVHSIPSNALKRSNVQVSIYTCFRPVVSSKGL